MDLCCAYRPGHIGALALFIKTVTHAAPNPVLFYAAISNFLVLRVRAEKGTIFGSYQLGRVK